ncbi:MAG: nitroreductase family protein [Desulfofustis sp.]|nr:nitroreductase family protein [Desulfofustis sp.]
MDQCELPIIDHACCTGCGACIDVCPDRILAADTSGRPEIVGQHCMLCGHCAALCPEGAITIAALADTLSLTLIDEQAPSDGPAAIAPADLVALMRRRRSCRRFTTEPVATALLSDLAKIGTTAPSGTNSQGWSFVILPRRTDVERLGQATADFYHRLNKMAANPWYRLASRLFAGDALNRYYRCYYQTIDQALRQWRKERIDRLFHGAPAAIIVTGATTASCPTEDALLATQSILLAAESCGLGTCLIGFVVEAARRDPAIAQLLRLGAEERIHAVIACGHPASIFRRPAGRKPIQPRILMIDPEEP